MIFVISIEKSKNVTKLSYLRYLFIKRSIPINIHTYIHTCYMVRSPPSRWSGLHHTHRVGGVTYVSTVLGW